MKDVYDYDSTYSDIDYSDSSLTAAIPYINWASKSGLVLGYGNGNYDPYAPVSHLEMYIIMRRYIALTDKKADVEEVTLWADDTTEIGKGWTESARENAIMSIKCA